MSRGSPDVGAIAVIMVLAFVGAAMVVTWVRANWDVIVLWISTVLVVALFLLAAYLVFRGGAIRR